MHVGIEQFSKREYYSLYEGETRNRAALMDVMPTLDHS